MATDTYRAVLELDATSMKRGAKDASNALAGVEGKLDRATGGMGRAQKAGMGLGRVLGTLGLAVGAGALVRSIVGAGAQFEVLAVQLETVTGSAENAEAALGFIKEFAAKTPFQVANITESFVGLKARGFDPTAESMKALGDLGAAFGKDITTSMQAVTQAAFGEGEMLKQFGIIMKQRGDEVSLTYKGVTKTVEKESKAIFGALIEMAQQSDGAMERMSATLTGRVSTMKDAWANFADVLSGSGINDALKKTVEAITKALNFITNNLDELAAAANTSMAQVVRAFGTLIEAAERITPLFAFLLNKILPDLTNDLELLAEGLDLQASEALERASKRAKTLGGDLNDLGADVRAVTGDFKQFGSTINVLQDASVPVIDERQVAAMVQIIEDGLAEIDLAEFRQEITASLEEATAEAMPKMALMWAELGDTINAILTNAMLGASDALADAFISGDFSGLEDAFADMGQNAGGQIGEGIGMFFGGPAGAALGNLLGQIVGESVGRSLGKAINSVLRALGLAPDPKRVLGSFAVGPGGFSGIGGTGEAQAQGQQQLDHIKAIFDALNRALGGTVEMSQNMLVQVKRNGEAVLQIIETATGKVLSTQSFGTIQQAVEAGLIQILSTSIINASGPMTAAFQELLGQVGERGVEGLVEAFETLSNLGTAMAALGGPADAAVTSYQNQVAQFAALEATIRSLGLSTEITDGLLADLTGRFERFQQAAELNVLGQLADMAEQFGLAAEFVKEVRLKEVELQFIILEATLKTMGIWKENRKLLNQLENAARRAVERMDQVGAGGATAGAPPPVVIKTPPRGIPVDVTNTEEFPGSDADEERDARISRATAASARFDKALARLRLGEVSELEAVRLNAIDEIENLLGEFGHVIDEATKQEFIRLRVLEVLNPKIESAFEAIASFRDSLRFSDFAPGSNADQANDALSDFLDLLAAAEGGDLDALEALPAAAQLALQLASEAFGTSTDAFEAIFNQITAGLDAVLGNQDSITADIQQQQLDILGIQTDTLNQSLTVQNTMAETLKEIRDAIHSGALQMQAAV